MRRQIAYNMDCMDLMKLLPDNEFDLAIVDPPYGGGYTPLAVDGLTDTSRKNKRQKPHRTGGIFSNAEEIKGGRTGGTWAAKYGSKVAQWDIAPDDEYFKELFRVSKRQIIWGGNYFNLGASRCYLVWRKSNIPAEGFSLAPVELAWTSLNENAAYFECGSNGAEDGTRIHPTQKPIALYTWILHRFAKPGDKILDTHLGSGSSRIAAHEMGYDFVGCEKDAEYFLLQEKRFKNWIAQQSLFEMDGGQPALF